MSEEKKHITALNITGKKIDEGDLVEVKWFFDKDGEKRYHITKIFDCSKHEREIFIMEAKIHDGEDKERT